MTTEVDAMPDQHDHGSPALDVACRIKTLPPERLEEAARTAVRQNPANAPAVESMLRVAPEELHEALTSYISYMPSKYWGPRGVRLTVGFLDEPPQDLRQRILSHMNAWGQSANVQFTESADHPMVRIARTAGEGYSSFLGTDVTHIPEDQPTMNLEGFTMNTPDREFYRVVRHETGHTLGFPHEHMRSEIVGRIDREKAIAYFRANDNWSAEQTDQQVLTPLAESEIVGLRADSMSIMCYWLPAGIMKDGTAVPGGTDIDAEDAQLAATIYPKAVTA
jgi:hypothetical protein